jgi:hypothetical protein
MRYRKLGLLLGLLLVAVAVVGTASAASSNSIPTVKDSQLQALFTTTAGAKVLSTTRTLMHWHGTAVNPDDGLTYGYNMVGADPYTCAGSACDATIPVDITPINVVVDGLTFSGSDVVAPTLASPQFATNDYGSTPAATIPSCTYNAGPAGILNGKLCGGAGGTLSQGDAGVPLQLEDATMRAQFNQTGAANPYHLRLGAPVVHPALTIVVPPGDGTLLQSGRGVIFASVKINWWASRVSLLNNTLPYSDPTHLPIYLTNNVLLHIGPDPTNCCVIGFHGASEVNGHGTGSTHGNGNQPVQTYAWASWVQPGIYSRPDHGTDWALQDIHALSHEISEWADDPFVNNNVEPWLTPTAPQYGCTGVLETGDPVVAIGFAMGTNTFEQGPNPNGTQSADGYYHPEDEVFLPWFMRTSPNNISEPVQSDPSNTDNGRYTLMGDLNPFPGFRAPATGC